MNDNRNHFYELADKSLVGLTELGGSLGVTHCTPPQLSSLIATARTARLQYNNARLGKRLAYVLLRQRREEADTFIQKSRDYFRGIFGPSWNEGWTAIGFENQNLESPNKDAGRVHVLGSIQAYFGEHDDKESPPLGVTLVGAEQAKELLSAAKNGTEACRFDQRSKREARDTAEQALENKLEVLWKELETVLAPTDARWLKFIDRIPGDPRVPERVEGVVASVQPGGIIVVDWPDAARASRYKLLKQVVGVDPEPVLAATVEDTDAQIDSIPEGATVQLQVVASNGVGDAPASDVIELQAA